MHGRHNRRMGLALVRRRGGNNARHAGDRSGQHGHVRRGDHRELAARHVAADRLHRDVLVAKDDARQGLDFDVAQRSALRLGKLAHLFLGELDVRHVARRDLVHRRFDLGGGKAKGGGRVIVELLRQLAHRKIAAGLDIRQDAGDDPADFFVILGALMRRFSVL